MSSCVECRKPIGIKFDQFDGARVCPASSIHWGFLCTNCMRYDQSDAAAERLRKKAPRIEREEEKE